MLLATSGCVCGFSYVKIRRWNTKQHSCIKPPEPTLLHKPKWPTPPWAVPSLYPDRQTERQTNRQTDRKKDRQTDTQTNRQTDRQTDKQTHKQTDRQTDRQAETPFSSSPCAAVIVLVSDSAGIVWIKPQSSVGFLGFVNL